VKGPLLFDIWKRNGQPDRNDDRRIGSDDFNL